MIKKKICVFIVVIMMVGVMFIGLIPEVDACMENRESKPTENSTVQGFVEDLEENPVLNAEVGLWDPANGNWNGVMTNESGYYILYTSPGYFYFNVHKDGFMDYYSDINIGENEEHWINVSLSLRPDEPCTLKGVVRNETEEPLNAHVRVENEEHTWWNDTGTDENGFEMNTICGNLEMWCDAPGYMGSSTTVSMVEGQVTWQNITLSKKPPENSRIYGWVNDTDGKPIAGADIELSNWEMGYWNSTYTEEDGYYSINCFAGTFDLEVRISDVTRYRDTITVEENEQKLFNITIKAENAKIYGWVTSEKGNPLKDVEISLSNKDYWNSTYTNENGYYEMNCFAGVFWLNAYLAGYDYSGFFDSQISISENEEKKVNITLKLIPPVVDGLTAIPETNISQNNPVTISANVTSAKLKDVYLVIEDDSTHQFIEMINITYSQTGNTFTGSWDATRFGLGDNTDIEMPVTVWQIFSDTESYYMVNGDFSSTGKPEDALDGYAVFNFTTLEFESVFANGTEYSVENGGIILGNSTFTVINMFMSGYWPEEQEGKTFVISLDFMLHQETAPDDRAYKAIIFGGDEEEQNAKDEITLYLDTTKPEITNQTTSQNIFSPEISSVFISADVSEDVEWAITIRNSTAIIKTFTGSGTIINQTWDGKDENDVMVDDGVYYIYFDGEDDGKNTAVTINITVSVDKTPPTTEIVFSGSEGTNEWYISNVTINFTGSDTPSGDILSGYDKTHYQVDNGVPESGVNPQITLTEEGIHVIKYYSVDKVGNQEVEKNLSVKIDKTSPYTTDNADSSWHNANVTITLTSTDLASEISTTVYGVDDDNCPNTGINVTITEEGVHTIYYRSQNMAGLWEDTKKCTVKIDKTSPSLSNLSSSTHPNSDIYYSNNTPSFSWESGDDYSGIAGYYHILDQSPTTEPTAASGTWIEEKNASFGEKNDGTWYFHVVAKDSAGNIGDVSHYRINIDTKQPVIAHIGGDMMEVPSGSSIKIDVEVTDTVGVASVTLYYKTLDEDAWKTLSMELETGNLYSVTIPKSDVTNDISYYFLATDTSENSVTFPKENPTTHPYKIGVVISEGEEEEGVGISRWTIGLVAAIIAAIGLLGFVYYKKKPKETGKKIEEIKKIKPRKVKYNRGSCYIIREQAPETSFKIFSDFVKKGAPGLCITRTNPEEIKEKHKLKNVELLWLTTGREDEHSINPTHIEKMTWTIKEFIKNNKNSVVLLDGVEYLIVQNNFLTILKSLQALEDTVSINKSMLIIPISPMAISEKEMSYLERDFVVV